MILVLVCLPVILAFSVFAINMAWIQLTRTELQTATDAAARAVSRTLSLTQDVDEARAAAFAGDPLLLATTDLQFGLSEPQTAAPWTFTEKASTSTDINAIRVTGHRLAGSPSSPVPLLFWGVVRSNDL